MSRNKTVAARLAAARKENNYTQEEIADLLKCSRATITNYENGRRSPDYDSLVVLAEKYNVTTDYLLGLTGAETSDKDIRYICDYTGLNEKAIKELHDSEMTYAKFINFCLGENENMIAFTTLITNFHMYKAWFRQKVEFKTTLLSDTTNKNIEQKEALEFVEKDNFLNDKINVTEFSVHKQIAELLNLYTESEKQEDEKNNNEYDFLILSLQNKVLNAFENNLIKGDEQNGND